MSIARKYWHLAGVTHKVGRIAGVDAPLITPTTSRTQVEERLGPALASLERLLEEHGQDSFDLAFIGEEMIRTAQTCIHYLPD